MIAAISVVAGFLVLRDISANDSGTNVVAPVQTTATTLSPEELIPVETTVPATLPLTSFKVQIANASKVAGSAGQLTTELQGRGFIVQPAVNTNAITPQQRTTTVYYLPGSEQAAALIAAEIGVTNLAPMPNPVPTENGSLGEASVLILLGTDIAGKPLGTPLPIPTTTLVATETTVSG